MTNTDKTRELTDNELLERYEDLGSRSNRLYCAGESTVEIDAEMDRVEAQLAERGLA